MSSSVPFLEGDYVRCNFLLHSYVGKILRSYPLALTADVVANGKIFLNVFYSEMEKLKIAEYVVIGSEVIVGEGFTVWPFANICSNTTFGNHCVVGSMVYVGKGAVLGDNVRIQDKAHITDHMKIGNRVFIGPSVVSCNDNYPVVNNKDYKVEPPELKDDVSIGAGAIIMPGVVIGAGSMIGAGAVVNKSISDHSIATGHPARSIKKTALEPTKEVTL